MQINQILYTQEPLTWEFEAQVVRKAADPQGRSAVVLDRTYFYPTGGGQEHDTGTLGEARVVDVYKDEEQGVTVHVLDRDLPLGPVSGRIDGERRLRHMQHHTAQHLLTQCFVTLFNYPTVSANINGNTPSTLDLNVTQVSRAEWEQAETLANEVIYQNRTVKSYFVEGEEIGRVPFRRPPPKVARIRVVEIDSYDYSACSGSHCPSTAMIGVVKILKVERQNEKMRVYFVAGKQAWEYYQMLFDTVSSLAAQMNTNPQDLPQAVSRQGELLKAAQHELQTLLTELIAWEAQQLAQKAEQMGEHRLVLASFEGRPAAEVRTLADTLKSMPGTLALLATYDGQKVSLVAACAPDCGFSAQEVLRGQFARIGGRGGGDAAIAQGGGGADPEQFRAFWAEAQAQLRLMISKNG